METHRKYSSVSGSCIQQSVRFIQVVVCLTSLFPLLLTSVPVYEPFVYHSPYDAHVNCSRLGLV